MDFTDYLKIMKQHHPDGLCLEVNDCDFLTYSPQGVIENTSKSPACSVFRIKPTGKTEKLILKRNNLT
jgi:hypothetical protein